MFPGLGPKGLQCGRRTRVEMDEKFVMKKTIRKQQKHNLTTDKPNCDHQGSDRSRANLAIAGILFGTVLSVKLQWHLLDRRRRSLASQ